MGESYDEFLRGKADRSEPVGFEPGEINGLLFEWQRDIVRWACRRGRASIFADCGLGKTAMQLEWARQSVDSMLPSNAAALVVAPLAVAEQTVAEGRKFGIGVTRVREMPANPSGIYVTNYEMLQHFDLGAFVAVVLDESSILKSHDSKTRKALTDGLRDVPYVLCCTATPAPNDQMELGTHAEICGAMTRTEMLATFFTHDGGDTSKWRLKGHAKSDFYRWMATWAVMLSRPQDIGYEASGYDLPELRVKTVNVPMPTSPSPEDGRLFEVPAEGIQDVRRARRESLPAKVKAIAEKVNGTPGQWCVWCELNDESSALAAAIPDYVVVMRKPGDNPEPIRHTSDEFPVDLWQKWASPIWMDINQSRTLNARAGREDGDERHICPLQLDVIHRCVGLWSNPGDLVLSPFGGIGSEGYESLLMGREYVGIELKPSYFREACRNLADAERQKHQTTLF